MLNYDENPTIRWAILRRLDSEPGVKVLDITIAPLADKSIGVQVEVWIDQLLEAISRFDLPEEFSHGHLLNEIDQMAEQFKAARSDFWARGRPNKIRHELSGTGLRGLWPTDVAKRELMVGARGPIKG